MELVSKNMYEVIAKESIEYVDKKTGEIKNLLKLYVNNCNTGIQEQLLVSKDIYTKVDKGTKGTLQFDKAEKGTYFKGFNVSK